MLAAGAAEALQRVAGDVVAARDRDLLDRIGHVVDGDADEALGHLVRRHAGRARRSRRSGASDGVGVDRLIAAGPEDMRENARA